MTAFDGNAAATATALARYAEDFLPAGQYGVTAVPAGVGGETVLGVYGKPAGRDRAWPQLDLYNALLRRADVTVAGRAVGEAGRAWAVVVPAGRLSRPLAALLRDLLDRRVAQADEPDGRPADRALAERRIRLWADWRRTAGRPEWN